MRLTSAQVDRACGVLVASAAGDALGAGYEFEHIPADLEPAMIGGGLGDFAPGEWTDDTAQAMAIASVAARGLDLRTAEALDQIAAGFLEWYAGNPPDVGNQTRHVLDLAGPDADAARMAHAAQQVHYQAGRSAGNGSLMRTGPVALAHLNDPAALVEAAMSISALTHYEDHAQEACALWSLMIRHTVLHGEFPRFEDIAPWVPRPEKWQAVLADAERLQPSAFTSNLWAVGALQAAWSAIVHTPVPEGLAPALHLSNSLRTAIRIGQDTDTVAAIAGALLGAKWGMTAVPTRWRRMVHGWPGSRVADLERLAYLATSGGQPGPYGWPTVSHIDFTDMQWGTPPLVQHPHDPGVWLGTAIALEELPDGVDAVVSLCLTGNEQVSKSVEQISFRLIDSSDEEENPNLDLIVRDAAQTVADLRAEGRTVLLHCVASHSRTPTVAVAYSLHLGMALESSLAEIQEVLPVAQINSGFQRALRRIAAV